jgi:riboflavin kinase/FMN adenylyltransferase
VEAYVLDREDLDLYGETVAVDFALRLRGNDRFETVDDLLAQIALDVERTRTLLG